MPKSKFKSVFMVEKLTVKQLLLYTFAFNFLIYIIFYNDWLTGKINLLGAPDTVIPFYSSFYMTNSISNLNFSSWNFFNQTDFAYAHMSTGWWTTSGLVTAIIAVFTNYFVEIDGQKFIQIHLSILIACQLFLRLSGMILIMKKYNIKNSVIIITCCLVSPILFDRFSLSFHVSIIYSSIFLLIYLIDNLKDNFNYNSISKFLIFALAIVFQEPLFAIAYLGQVIFCYIIFQLISYVKDNKILIKKLFSRSKSKLFSPKFSFSFVHTANFIFLVLIIFIFYIWSKSINNNYFFLNNRAQSPFMNLQTLKILVGTPWSEDFSKILNTSSTGMVSGWPFFGVTFIFFSILGLIDKFDRRFIAIKSLACVFILMQFSMSRKDFNITWSIFDLPDMIIKIIGAVLRVVFYTVFPFSFLFRSGGMLVWLIASVLLIFFAIGLDKFIHHFGQRLIHKNYLVKILVALILMLSLNRSLYVLLTICIGIFINTFFYFLPKITSNFENIVRFVPRFIIPVFLIFDLVSSTSSAEVSQYSGANIVPNSFIFKNYSTPLFIPQYVTPFSRMSFKSVSPSISPDVLPISKASLLSVYKDNHYFGANELNSYFYQVTYMGNYKFDSNYQNKNILFSNYTESSQSDYLPTAIYDSPDQKLLPVSNTIINNIEVGSIYKVIRNTNGTNLYVYNCKVKNLSLRSNFDPQINSIFFELNGENYFPVKGKPISENAFDFGNYYSGKLTFVSSSNSTAFNNASFKLFSTNTNVIKQKNAFLSSEIFTGGLKIDNTIQNSNSITFAIPFQNGWKINPDSNASLHNGNGWLKAENLESKIYYLEFNPYFPLPYYLPFLFLLWVSYIFFRTPLKLLNTKVFKQI